MVLYFLTFVGGTKLLTIILGGISYGLGVYSYDETIIQEEYFLRSVQICFIISMLYYFPHVISEKFATSEVNKAVDIALHITGFVVLSIGAGLVLYSTIDNERVYCEILWITYPEHFCQFYRVKLAAGLVTLLNGILYALVATFVFLSTAFNKDSKRTKNYLNGNQMLRNCQNSKYHNQHHQHNQQQIPKHNNYNFRHHQQEQPSALRPPSFSTLPKYSYYYGDRF